MRTPLFVFLLAIVIIFGAAPCLSETLAVVIKVQGEVTVTPEGQDSGDRVDRGHRLEDGDMVQTGENSFAAIRFVDDASLVRIRPQSTCTIRGNRDKGEVHKNVFVEVGAILTDITMQRGKFEVATPTSVASVKGTRFITEHEGQRGTKYFGEKGTVEISNDSGMILLKPGLTAHVSSNTAEIVVKKTKKGEKPEFEDIKIEDAFEMEFEDASGRRRTLKFRVKEQ